MSSAARTSTLLTALALVVLDAGCAAGYLTAYRPPVFKQEVNCPSMENGQFSHPSFCDQFLNCWEGEAVIGQCPPGLVFNEMSGACDYSQNVNCEGRGSSRPPAPVSEDCPDPDGTFPSRKNCSEFVVCQNGNATVYSCPEELHYDQEFRVCVHKRDSSCQQISIPGGEPESPPDPILKPPFEPSPPSEFPEEMPSNPPSVPAPPPASPSPPPMEIDQVLWPAWPNWPSTTKCPILQGFLPVMGQCESVVVCIGGLGQLLRCPVNHSFDMTLGRCSASPTKGCMHNNANAIPPAPQNRVAVPAANTFIGNPFGGVVPFIYYPNVVTY